MKRNVLQSGLLKWAKIISRTLGVDIVFSGHQPMTDGKTIQAFALPDIIDTKVENALIGAIDHECGHIDPDTGSELRSTAWKNRRDEMVKKYGPLGFIAWNVLEDMRIESRFLEKFPGAFKYLEAIREWLWENSNQFDAIKDSAKQNSAVTALTGLGYLRYPRLFKEHLFPIVNRGVLLLIHHWRPYVKRACNAKDWRESFDLAEEMLQELQQAAQESGEREGDENSVEVPAMGSPDGEAGDGSGEGVDWKEALDQKESEGNDGKAMKDAAKSVLKDGEKHGELPDFGAGSFRDIDKKADGAYDSPHDSYRVDDKAVGVVAPPNNADANSVAEDSRNLYPVLRQRIRSLLLAERMNSRRTNQFEGDLDPDEIYTLGIKNGPRNVFSTFKKGEQLNTSVLFLIDGSGSMAGNESIVVMRCAYFLADCMERCAIPSEVAVFQDKSFGCGAQYSVIKSFNEKVSRVRRKFRPYASGGTPMAEAMTTAIQRLSERGEDRRILFILTDGAPNRSHGNSPAYMRRLADAVHESGRIEVIGLGVSGSSSVSSCFRDFVMLDDGSNKSVDLKFVELLHDQLLKRRKPSRSVK